jgi:hypothetical protein
VLKAADGWQPVTIPTGTACWMVAVLAVSRNSEGRQVNFAYRPARPSAVPKMICGARGPRRHSASRMTPHAFCAAFTTSLPSNGQMTPGCAVYIVSARCTPPLQIGLILLAIAAGAPFLPKLVQVAKGDERWPPLAQATSRLQSRSSSTRLHSIGRLATSNQSFES